jgi:hypothetical protein
MRSADYQAGRVDAVAGLLALIRAEAERADGSWNGDDVVHLLRQWFTVHGIDICRPGPTADQAAGQLGAGPAGLVRGPGAAVGKLITAARHVLGSWAMGDLAGAVNELRQALELVDKTAVAGAEGARQGPRPCRSPRQGQPGPAHRGGGAGTVAGDSRDG